jgi:hypothetical protein
MELKFLKIVLVAFLFCPLSLCAQTISKEDIEATVRHRDALVQQLVTEHDAALASKAETDKQLLAEQTAHAQAEEALSANSAAIVDLKAQISAKDAAYRALERKDVWDKWKWSILGGLTGIVCGIAFVFLGKAGMLGAEIAAKF